MSLTVRYIGYADALSMDGRQAMTITNFDPSNLIFDRFPASWPLVLIAIFESSGIDELSSAGIPFTGQASVFDPKGLSLVTLPVAGATQARPIQDFPPRFFLGVSAALTFTTPGNYRLEMSMSISGQTAHAERPMYVRGKPPT